MGVRKSAEEELVVNGSREEWFSRLSEALLYSDFKNVKKNESLFQIQGDYKKLTTWGTLEVTLIPDGDSTKIKAVATANVDNIYALFKSPTKAILQAFKDLVK